MKNGVWLLVLGAIGLVLIAGPAMGSVGAGRRDPNDIFTAVAQLNPETNPVYQPGYNGGASWCNKFIADVLFQLGISFPGPPTLANNQINYLTAGNDGWAEVDDMYAAQAAALSGQVAIATYWNPSGPGHMALVLPVDGPVVMSAQAGGRNWNQKPLLGGFGLLPVWYFVHA